MNKNHEQLDILAIGLDSFSIETIKASLLENKLKYQLVFLRDVSELSQLKKRSFQAIFFYSNRQSQKTVDDIRRIHQSVPGAGITLLSPKSDLQGIVGAFRAGLFDFLSLPLDKQELRTVIYRLKIHGAIQSGKWNPERAVLHLFSRPESFATVEDIALNLQQYLNMFFTKNKEIVFTSNLKLLESLKKKLRFSQHQIQRIKHFLSDETGLIFGLRFIDDHFYFLMKRGDGNLSYVVL